MRDSDLVRRGYDAVGAAYAERPCADRDRAVLEAFFDSMPGPIRLLDAGCGPGTPVLCRLRDEVTAVGLDLSRGQLRLAAETAPAAHLVQGDMTALPFPEATFDAVTALNSLIHVPRCDHGTVIEEFARVLRPGGRVLLSEAPEPLERSTDDWLGCGVEMTWHMAGAATTRDQLRDAGFRLTREWTAPETSPDEPPEPPVFAARLGP